MIHFFSGAPKNGSHFQLYVFLKALEQQNIEHNCIDVKPFSCRSYSICSKVLNDFGKEDGFFWIKSHFGPNTKDIETLVCANNIRMYVIWRDIRDVLVSSYFFQLRFRGIGHKDFVDYYRKNGVKKIVKQCVFKKNWTFNDDRVCHSDYNALVNNFEPNANNILKHAGIQNVDLADLKDRMSIDRCRIEHEDPEGKFFRKGIVGDYKNVIPADFLSKVESDIKKYEAKYGIKIR